jgi:hypothetical protein
MFEDINNIILEVIKLEEKIVGTAIRIEHPILQLAWIAVGLNQLNDVSIDSNIYIQSLLSMLLKEEKIISELDKQYYVKLITAFVHHLDNIGGTRMDNKISIFELNYVKPNKNNSNSVKELIEYEYNNIIDQNDEIKINNEYTKNKFNTLINLHNKKEEKELLIFPNINHNNENKTDCIDQHSNTSFPTFYSNKLYIKHVHIKKKKKLEPVINTLSQSKKNISNDKDTNDIKSNLPLIY